MLHLLRFILRPFVVVAEVPRVHWEDIGGMNDVKQNLREVVEWPMKHQALFKDLE